MVGNEDFSRLAELDLTFYPGARRFDVNEPAAFLNLASGTASLDYLNQVTPAVVERHVQSMLLKVLDSLPVGFRPVGLKGSGLRSNILCITPDKPDWLMAAHQALKEAAVVVSVREGALRISPHLYNTHAHIDQLLQALKRFSGHQT